MSDRAMRAAWAEYCDGSVDADGNSVETSEIGAFHSGWKAAVRHAERDLAAVTEERDRLRAENEELRSVGLFLIRRAYHAERDLAAATEERDRLREALGTITENLIKLAEIMVKDAPDDPNAARVNELVRYLKRGGTDGPGN